MSDHLFLTWPINFYLLHLSNILQVAICDWTNGRSYKFNNPTTLSKFSPKWLIYIFFYLFFFWAIRPIFKKKKGKRKGEKKINIYRC